MKAQQRKIDWWRLVAPWATIALVGVLFAVFQLDAPTSSSFEDASFLEDEVTWGRRDLVEDSASSSFSQQPHHHKPVYNEDHAPLFPLTTSDYYGFFFAIVGLMVAAGGGIGGGGMLVPIYILIFGFSPKHAIPLSNITVFGGAIANTLLNSRKRHPLADRPLVDWDLILVMEPLVRDLLLFIV